VYFVEAGQVTETTSQGPNARRVQSLGAGTIVGELGLYQNGTYTSSARTDRETQLYRLSRDALEQMHANDPELVAAFHQLMAGLLAQRLSRVDHEIDLLLR
jgi:SulP family sulfate permease